MSKAWSHLPNAHHIDWVLASLKENPEFWSAARDVALAAARDAARAAASVAAWAAARDAMTWDVISALVSYDDCDQFLNMPYEKLRVWAVLSEDPRAILLIPMVYVKEKLANLNLQPA